MLLLFMACRPAPVSVVAALHSAAAGAPEAWAQCAALANHEDQGHCIVTAVEATRDTDPARCAGLVVPRWSGECSFVQAEIHAQAQQWSAALDACSRAGALAPDCARHVWEESVRAGQVSVVRPLVEARFPGTMEQLRQDEGGVSVEAARTATITQQEQDALAQSQAEASQAYAQHFQNLTPIDVTWCEQQAFPELCVDAAADLIEVRLRRAFERDPSVYTAFCNQQPMAMRKLAWVASPALDARVATLRSALCGGDGKPGSP